MQKPEQETQMKVINGESKMAKKQYELWTSAFYDFRNKKGKIEETDEVRESAGQRPAGHEILFSHRVYGPR